MTSAGVAQAVWGEQRKAGHSLTAASFQRDDKEAGGGAGGRSRLPQRRREAAAAAARRAQQRRRDAGGRPCIGHRLQESTRRVLTTCNGTLCSSESANWGRARGLGSHQLLDCSVARHPRAVDRLRRRSHPAGIASFPAVLAPCACPLCTVVQQHDQLTRSLPGSSCEPGEKAAALCPKPWRRRQRRKLLPCGPSPSQLG